MIRALPDYFKHMLVVTVHFQCLLDTLLNVPEETTILLAASQQLFVGFTCHGQELRNLRWFVGLS